MDLAADQDPRGTHCHFPFRQAFPEAQFIGRKGGDAVKISYLSFYNMFEKLVIYTIRV